MANRGAENLKTAEGEPKRGPGRPKGMENKVPRTIKEMILGALDAKGGQAWIEEQMDTNPGPVLALIGKIIPQQTQVSGPDGGPVANKLTVEFVDTAK